MASKVAIIGCGWLGFPLAKNLVQKGFEVKGSTTSSEKLGELKSVGIQPYRVAISEDKITGDIDDMLADCELLIINIPPGLRKNPSANFVKKIKLLKSHIETSTIKKVLFVSSTSVYGDATDVITEKSVINPTSKSGKQLVKAEKTLKSSNYYQITIVRFSGLIGANRHPIKFLSGKTGLDNGNTPVNLVHLNDCIDSILFTIQNDLWDEEFNISYPDHPPKESYYNRIAKDRKLALPLFNKKITTKSNKVISSEKIQTLGFRFKSPI
ncbi:NAD(P)-binding domain-containing protein [Spongiivirga citrea]|uniref:NAD(P)H-binding protein n=1 Tax=Spongiivirga citrea TaxID=1481457 RepID=A0A6M0CLW0_9FLAO|nr:NAD(P)-binding domain-containing protein [Spongiivirga citrea]NER17963.1 NAD(P)H-binding protein [Spongiivirga citrea]